MQEHNTNNDKNLNVVEDYKEEGMLTVEALDIASEEATHQHHKKHTLNTTKYTLTTPVAIIIASIIISVGLMGYGYITSQNGNSKSPSKAIFAGRNIDDTDFVEGNKDSKVVVVEYSDPECPYCISVYPTIKQLRTQYKDNVAFVYRHFPLTTIHPHAFNESKAITCAGVVGGTQKYFEYIDALFEYKVSKQNQRNPSPQLSSSGKEDIAKNIGLNTQKFTECMDNKQTEKNVNDSTNDGIAAGVQGTPSTFILVKTKKSYEVVSMVDGARPYEYFKTVLDQALSK